MREFLVLLFSIFPGQWLVWGYFRENTSLLYRKPRAVCTSLDFVFKNFVFRIFESFPDTGQIGKLTRNLYQK